MPKLTPQSAQAILRACAIPIPADFHKLSRVSVESLLLWASHYKYSKPKNANGSRARYYHDYLQRVAARKSS